jgi:hypothetical protein
MYSIYDALRIDALLGRIVVLYYKSSLNDLIDLICSGLFTFSADKWEQVSPEAKNLIENLLVVDPD